MCDLFGHMFTTLCMQRNPFLGHATSVCVTLTLRHLWLNVWEHYGFDSRNLG